MIDLRFFMWKRIGLKKNGSCDEKEMGLEWLTRKLLKNHFAILERNS
jgi:hypothetical protein